MAKSLKRQVNWYCWVIGKGKMLILKVLYTQPKFRNFVLEQSFRDYLLWIDLAFTKSLKRQVKVFKKTSWLILLSHRKRKDVNFKGTLYTASKLLGENFVLEQSFRDYLLWIDLAFMAVYPAISHSKRWIYNRKSFISCFEPSNWLFVMVH